MLAPFGVATGVTVFISLSIFLAKGLGIANLSKTLSFVPQPVLRITGVSLILFWLPFFISGIYYLGRRGAVGQSETLIDDGIYKYVRNPMYSGVSFTIIGIGLLINQTGVVFAGILWLCMAFIQCKREEKELAERFGENYIQYKNKTPMLIPNIFKR